ncbi:antigen peptide transporter 2-like [Pelobates cultripes]|uniref:Antigen peptide transporter 2-like n=1 Tax=Pelobates cultripes TaxID=61616 RepID=A0AAD1T1Z1_PELCU|nr:antigen peptide transporter 2-like [Pelobates cultripes]
MNIILRSVVKCIGVYSFMISISWQLTLLTFVSSPLTWIIQKVYDHYYEIVNLASYVTMLLYGQILIENGFITSGKMVSFILYQMESGEYISNLSQILAKIDYYAGIPSQMFQFLPNVGIITKLWLCRLFGVHGGGFTAQSICFPFACRLTILTLDGVKCPIPTIVPGVVNVMKSLLTGNNPDCISLFKFCVSELGPVQQSGGSAGNVNHGYLEHENPCEQVALVAQEPVLFSGSVKDNIGYGLKDMPEEQLKEAARKANAETFILGMEKGYDTDVGENGSRLGAGQKQRLAIARALARRPQLLILDEASSSLDPVTEHEIQKSLQEIEGLSLLIIAHRLRTVEKADQILVLDGGHLVECGTHKDLVERKGVYHSLLNGHVLQNGE